MRSRDLVIDQLKILPHGDVLQFLVAAVEDQWLERVSGRIQPTLLAELMVGFANAEGGLIAIGIHRGNIEGVTGAPGNRLNDWRQAALDFTKPPVRHKFELVPCTNACGELDEIAVVEIEASEHVHTNQKDDTFLRVGDENR